MTLQEIFLVLMMLGLFAGILSGIAAMLAIAGVPLLIALMAHQAGVFDLNLIALFPARVWGIMQNGLLMAVPLFVLMGVLLERARLAEAMLGVLARMMGGSPRGMALSVLLFSALIAAATGIVGATVVMLVLVGLRPMLTAGIPPARAAGLICACGTLGQIIPPSVLLVLLGDQIGNTYTEAQQRAGNFAPDVVSVGDLFAGALIPGLVLVAIYAAYLAITLRPARGVVRERVPKVPLVEVAETFLPTMLLILAVLGSILAGVATATEAAGLGAIGAMLLAAHAGMGRRGKALMLLAGGGALMLVGLRMMGFGRAELDSVPGIIALIAAVVLAAGVGIAALRLLQVDRADTRDGADRVRDTGPPETSHKAAGKTGASLLGASLAETTRISGMVFGIVIAASLLALVFRGLGGDREVMRLMAHLPGGEWGALIIVMGIVFVLGFMLEAIEIIYIVVPLLGPPLLMGDISPVWFAVLLAMNLQTSFLTPPFGFALFYFRSAAPREITTMQIYRGVTPFVLLQLGALAIVAAWPDLATWLPGLIFG